MRELEPVEPAERIDNCESVGRMIGRGLLVPSGVGGWRRSPPGPLKETADSEIGRCGGGELESTSAASRLRRSSSS